MYMYVYISVSRFVNIQGIIYRHAIRVQVYNHALEIVQLTVYLYTYLSGR